MIYLSSIKLSCHLRHPHNIIDSTSSHKQCWLASKQKMSALIYILRCDGIDLLTILVEGQVTIG